MRSFQGQNHESKKECEHRQGQDRGRQQVQDQDQQHRESICTGVKNLAVQREEENRMKVGIKHLGEELQRRRIYEQGRIEDLDVIIHHAQQLKGSIPGRTSCTVPKEIWMDALATRMSEAGESPSNTLACIRAEQEGNTEAEKVELYNLAHRERDSGGNGNPRPRETRPLQRRANVVQCLQVLMRRRLEAANGYLQRLERALLACEARKRVLNRAIEGAMEEFRALLVESRRVAVEAKACKAALAEIEAKPPSPVNSVSRAVREDWQEGQEYTKFVDRTKRLFGEGSDELFVATEVISQQHRDSSMGDYSGFWAVNVGTLGEGTFGAVLKLTVPTLGKSYASKECKTEADDDVDSLWLARYAKMTLVAEMFIHNSIPLHENIVQPVAIDDRLAEKLVVMYELAEGDFSSYAWGHQTASIGVVMRLLADMARGLEHLQLHGFGHNDIKPDNMLLFQEAGVLVAKVTDLGCALAHGDIREGQGTIGGRVPEGMMRRKVVCEPSQDVYAFAHLVLLTFSKEDLKSHNMWISAPLLSAEDIRFYGHKKSKAERSAFVDEVTLRNQLSPRARAKLLNPDNLVDDLGDGIKEELVGLLASALSPDPVQRPPMSRMVTAMTTMAEVSVQNDGLRGNLSVAVAAQAISAVEISPTPSAFNGDFGLNNQSVRMIAPVDLEVRFSGQGEATPPSLGDDAGSPTLNIPLVNLQLVDRGDLDDDEAQAAPVSGAPAQREDQVTLSPSLGAHLLTVETDSGDVIGGGGPVAPIPCDQAMAPAGGLTPPMPGVTSAVEGEIAGGQACAPGSPKRKVTTSAGGEPVPIEVRREKWRGRVRTGKATGVPGVTLSPAGSFMKSQIGKSIKNGGSGGRGTRNFPRTDGGGPSGSTPRNPCVRRGYGVGGGRHSPPQDNLRQVGYANRGDVSPRKTAGGVKYGFPLCHQQHVGSVARGDMSVFTPRNHYINGSAGRKKCIERGSKRHTTIKTGRNRRRGKTYCEQTNCSSSCRGKIANSARTLVPQPQYQPQQPCARAAGVTVASTFYPYGPSALKQQVQTAGWGTGPDYCSTGVLPSLPLYYNYPVYTSGAGGISVPLALAPVPFVTYAPYFPRYPVGEAVLPRYW